MENVCVRVTPRVSFNEKRSFGTRLGHVRDARRAARQAVSMLVLF